MRLTNYPWIKYNCEKVPNEFECTICGGTMEIYSPARYSTALVLGKKFAGEHMHEKKERRES